MAGDYNSRSNIILDENGTPIREIEDIFEETKLKAIFGKGLQVHPIYPKPLQKTKPTKFLPPPKSLESYQTLCNQLYTFYSTQSPQLLPPPDTASTGGNKPRKTRKYKKLVTRKNKKHTNKLKKYKKYKYILRRKTNKKRKH